MMPTSTHPATPDSARAGGDRRTILRELVAAVTRIVAETDAVTAAALRVDRLSLTAAADSLYLASASQAFDLRRINEVYGALRDAVAACRPTMVVEVAIAMPATGAEYHFAAQHDRGTDLAVAAVADLDSALTRMTDVEGVLARMRRSNGSVTGPDGPPTRSDSPARPTTPDQGERLRWPSTTGFAC